MNDIKKKISIICYMKNLGETDVNFGMKIIRSPNSIPQSHYTQLLIDKFGYSDFPPISTPFDPSIKLFKNSNKLAIKKSMLKSLDL